MYLSVNIKFLRKRKNRTQSDVANELDLKRSTLSGYENNVAEPDIATLIKLSKYFRIPVDALLKEDLNTFLEREIQSIELNSDIQMQGSSLRILTSTISPQNEENIELVHEKAKAGYTRGYADPEYIRELPCFQLPFLSKNRKYRTFQIDGDSMIPIPSGSWVTGEFIQNWLAIKDGDAAIILTIDDGIVFKLIENHLKDNKELVLHSLNKEYKPYNMPVENIREIWKFVHYISPEMPESLPPDIELHKAVANLQSDVKEIKDKLEEEK
jgi:transcriptional regulator with XRE-family HTH domain